MCTINCWLWMYVQWRSWQTRGSTSWTTSSKKLRQARFMIPTSSSPSMTHTTHPCWIQRIRVGWGELGVEVAGRDPLASNPGQPCWPGRWCYAGRKCPNFNWFRVTGSKMLRRHHLSLFMTWESVWLERVCDSRECVTWESVWLERVCDLREFVTWESVWLERVCDLRECVTRESVWLERVCDSRECVTWESVWLDRVCDSRECVTRESVWLERVCDLRECVTWESVWLGSTFWDSTLKNTLKQRSEVTPGSLLVLRILSCHIFQSRGFRWETIEKKSILKIRYENKKMEVLYVRLTYFY